MAIALLLAVGALPQPSAAQEDAGNGVTEEEQAASEARAALTNCQCLQCFPSAISFVEAMADGYSKLVRDAPAILRYWDEHPDMHADFTGRDEYLEQAYWDIMMSINAEAVEASPPAPGCQVTGDDAIVMRTSLASCEILQRAEGRMRIPCDDLYLGVLAHELVHRQFCADLAPNPLYADEIAKRAQTEVDAYRTEADVLRILYLRRARDCRAPTTRTRFTDLPDAVDFLNRALNYERDNPLMSLPANTP